MSYLKPRALLMTVTIGVSLVCFGVLRASDTEQQESTTPHDAPYESSGEQKEAEHAIKLEGKGRQATHKFELREGLAVVEVRNEGKANFIVELPLKHQ